MTNQITIYGISITQDAEGRFRLNDFHKASGGEDRHKPSNWERVQQTKELISEIKSTSHIRGVEQNQPLITINGGSNPGTYVCKELVYSYAMWVSAKFNLEVIRTFDAVVNECNELTEDELDIQRAEQLVTLLKFRLETKRKIKELQSVTEAQSIQIDELKTNVSSVESKIKEFDSETGYRTVVAYSRDNKIKLPLKLASSIGVKAANLCKKRNIKIGKVSDERFGYVNSYPISILDEVVAPLNLL